MFGSEDEHLDSALVVLDSVGLEYAVAPFCPNEDRNGQREESHLRSQVVGKSVAQWNRHTCFMAVSHSHILYLNIE